MTQYGILRGPGGPRPPLRESDASKIEAYLKEYPGADPATIARDLKVTVWNVYAVRRRMKVG